ncbi:MAG: putative toxin-antitoxin system toxin component, PIN family [Microcystaceae cyanobacterium]
MNVLLDTNIWISGLLWGGNPRKIINLAEHQEIAVYTSLPLLDELRITLTYPKFHHRLQQMTITVDYLMTQVNNITELCQPIALDNIPELRDPNDQIVLETAVTIPVHFIISGDLDLLVLREFQGIQILTSSQFLERYQQT